MDNIESSPLKKLRQSADGNRSSLSNRKNDSLLTQLENKNDEIAREIFKDLCEVNGN